MSQKTKVKRRTKRSTSAEVSMHQGWDDGCARSQALRSGEQVRRYFQIIISCFQMNDCFMDFSKLISFLKDFVRLSVSQIRTDISVFRYSSMSILFEKQSRSYYK